MKNRIITFLILLITSSILYSQNIPEPMRPYRLVNDFANIFTNSERQALEARLITYNDTTSTQIYIVTLNDLDGYPISDYAFLIGEKWGIGQSSKDNGILILIKPNTNDSRGQAFIATGYGLEAYITDAIAGRIIRNNMIPYFKENDFFGGTNAAIDSIIMILSGEFDPDPDKKDGLPTWLIVLILITLFIIITSSGGNKNVNRGGHGGSGGGPIFFPSSGRNNRSGWSGKGGSFGGGGGGRFGGGGAGGSW